MATSSITRILRRRILLAVGDQEMRTVLNRILERTGYDVICCYCARTATSLMRSAVSDEQNAATLDLFVCDARLLTKTTAGEIACLQSKVRFPPLVLVTAFAGDEDLSQAARLRSAAVFDTGFDFHRQLAIIRQLAPYPSDSSVQDTSCEQSKPSFENRSCDINVVVGN